MNLSQENLYILSKANKSRIDITVQDIEGTLTPYSLMKSLTDLTIALDQGTGPDIIDMNMKNNINICKIISSTVQQHKPKKLFKLPQGIMNTILKPEQQSNTMKANKVLAKEDIQYKLKSVKEQNSRSQQKHRANQGFVTANLLQKKGGNKQPQKQTQHEPMSAQNSGVTSFRKKFVPPLKKQDVIVQDIEQDKNKEKDVRYKNLDPKLVQSIQSEILESGAATKWEDIAGLGFAKKTIHEMIVWPMLRPDIFVGLRAPPKGVLLFGPPGTGKTLIGKAIASESGSTFFNISASSLTSKWVGEGQKMVKTLFAVALIKQPSVIFIDEIDSLLCSRTQNQQQSSRKIKTQFLVQLDGAKSNTNERILIIGATNRPNELDEAVRRRFVKKLYIPLPNHSGRVQLFKNISQEQGFSLTKQDCVQMAKLTKGYSGADLHNLCAQSSLIPIRKIDIKSIGNNQIPLTKVQDVKQALNYVKSTVNASELKLYQDWNKQFGSYQIDSSMDIDS